VNYEIIDAEVVHLIYELQTADDETIASHQARLRAMAEQIPDDLWRRRALQRVGTLPELIRPRLGTSPQYSQAVTLVGRAHGLEGPVDERIAEVKRTKRLVAELARQAPRHEYMTIMRMNSSLVRMIERLESRVGRSRHQGG
jgi:hypothetical protein